MAKQKQHASSREDDDEVQRQKRAANPECVRIEEWDTCGCGSPTEAAWIASSVRRCERSRVVLS